MRKLLSAVLLSSLLLTLTAFPQGVVIVHHKANASFSPADIPGLRLWLKADALSLANNDPVATWPDSSGNGNDATATGTVRPTYKTNQINSTLPAVFFDGTAPNYLTFADNAFSSFTAAEIFIVVKILADPPPSGATSGIWKLYPDDGTTHYPFTDGTIYDQFGSTVRKTVGNPGPTLAAWRLYEVRSVTNDWQCYLDGASLFSTATNTVGFPVSARIGDGDSISLNGYIAEVCMFNKGLNSTERQQMWDYIESKYGITLP